MLRTIECLTKVQYDQSDIWLIFQDGNDDMQQVNEYSYLKTLTVSSFIILDTTPVLESPYLGGPTVVSNIMNDSWIEFYCQLENSDAGSNSIFQITFLFEDVEDPNIPRFTITGSDGRATLHEKYLVGHMGTSVRIYFCSLRASMIMRIQQHFFR